MNASLQIQLNILDYALASLWRKKLKNFSVFLIFTGIIFILASFQFLSSSLSQTALTLLVNVPDIIVQQLSGGRQVPFLTENTQKLDEIFGIRSIQTRVWGYYFDESNGANYTIMGIDLPLKSNLFPKLLASGSYDGMKKRGDVILGQYVFENMGMEGRQGFSLFRPDLSMTAFNRVGVFAKTSNLLTGDIILMSLADAQDLFAMQKNQITDLLVNVGNPTEIATIAEKISDTIPGTRVLTKDQILKTYEAIFGWRSGFGSACFLAGLLAFVILAWDKGLGLSEEEKREVGILKILGWQTGDIMRLRFYESCVISLLAFFIGMTLAWGHLLFWDCSLLKPIFLGWSVLKSSFDIQPYIKGQDLLLIFSMSVLPYLAATVIPAWRSSIVKPDSVV